MIRKNKKLNLKYFAYINILKTNIVEKFYLYYFFCCSVFSARKKYIVIDIDNTVNDQTTRLLKFVKDGCCDYKKANKFYELIGDVPLPDSVNFICKLSVKFQIVWLTSRSIKTIPATYYWLRKNGFPVHALVCTGSMMRKISFMNIFIRKSKVSFVIDDLKEGYEYGNPHYVLPYKEFLEWNNIEVFEDLSAGGLQHKLNINDV